MIHQYLNLQPIYVEVWQDNSSDHGKLATPCDISVLLVDNPGTDNIEVWTSVYGDINQKMEGPLLILAP
jgi:hypothetical protein